MQAFYEVDSPVLTEISANAERGHSSIVNYVSAFFLKIEVRFRKKCVLQEFSPWKKCAILALNFLEKCAA